MTSKLTELCYDSRCPLMEKVIDTTLFGELLLGMMVSIACEGASDSMKPSRLRNDFMPKPGPGRSYRRFGSTPGGDAGRRKARQCERWEKTQKHRLERRDGRRLALRSASECYCDQICPRFDFDPMAELLLLQEFDGYHWRRHPWLVVDSERDDSVSRSAKARPGWRLPPGIVKDSGGIRSWRSL